MQTKPSQQGRVRSERRGPGNERKTGRRFVRRTMRHHRIGACEVRPNMSRSPEPCQCRAATLRVLSQCRVAAKAADTWKKQIVFIANRITRGAFRDPCLSDELVGPPRHEMPAFADLFVLYGRSDRAPWSLGRGLHGARAALSLPPLRHRGVRPGARGCAAWGEMVVALDLRPLARTLGPGLAH
jgi:hypothetical protein